jgi:hypothetical protein
MINDYSAYGNLSGHRTKRAKIYLIYGKDTHTVQLKHYEKSIYLGHMHLITINWVPSSLVCQIT